MICKRNGKILVVLALFGNVTFVFTSENSTQRIIESEAFTAVTKTSDSNEALISGNVKLEDSTANGTGFSAHNHFSTSSCGRVFQKESKTHTFKSLLIDLIEGNALERRKSAEGEFPWMAALVMIKNGQKFYCGGSLIDHWHVLTTASCVASLDAAEDVANIGVFLGTSNICETPHEPDDGRVILPIDKVAYNRNFDSRTMEGNIAIIRLKEPVHFTDLIQPICLPNATSAFTALHDDEGRLATVSGWGQLISDPLDNLNKLEVRIWDFKRCSSKYRKEKVENFPKVGEDSICAGSPVPLGKNLCQGNNGSPLVIKRQGDYFELIGITSWGTGVGLLPCIYTRVDLYVSWIWKTINSF